MTETLAYRLSCLGSSGYIKVINGPWRDDPVRVHETNQPESPHRTPGQGSTAETTLLRTGEV